MSANVLFWDIPRSQTGLESYRRFEKERRVGYLFRLLFLEKVVKVDKDDFEDEFGDEVGDVPHSDLWGPDDVGNS